ncbi:LysE family translocator [Pseudaestuariivita atlantica]|uniref:Amino acid transporter LysE n=1 Tax=Pseudaestuariivita atlantica TaxID=1317121 RepID=A0A0L1JU22_9RHOB|nr:LysE family translocator [Pseudaestuariivita atlantica]KNG95250.1 amino acid transporter LysE [Pseudaestuariivita atlantica]
MSVALGSFLVFAAAQVGSPGPANMALLATGAAQGFRRALPFVAGVALGKQLIIWPIGFGVMSVLARYPAVFEALKWAAVAYICWLAWRVAFTRLAPGAGGRSPGLMAGLAVHPLNPKAWAMILTAFTGFVDPATPALIATATVAAGFLAVQLVLHPVWAYFGDRLARTVAGTRYERALMVGLAVLIVLSVLNVLLAGGETP